MKKKSISFILAICLTIVCALALTACEENPPGGHTHSLTKVDAVAATCTTAGNTLYYKCDCGKFFSDEQAESEIDKDSWIIAETGHTWGEGVVTTPAMPSSDGVITYTCHCEETRTETFAYTSPAVVTEEEWNQAFADAMSKTVAKTMVLFADGSTEPTLTAMVKEDVFYMISGSYEVLLFTSEGKYYAYEKIDNSWSLNGKIITEESYNNQINYLWDNFLGYFKTGEFGSASFDADNETYTYSAVFTGTTQLEYEATFVEGKLTRWTLGVMNRTVTFDFTEPTIEIPQV